MSLKRISRDFVLAGKATFTIQSPDGKHRTYRVEMVEPTDAFPKPAFFVKTLVGPQNTEDYAYMGKLDPFTGQVKTTAKSKQWENTTRLRLLNRVLARVWSGDHAAYEQHNYRVFHAGTCGRCGRLLTTPDSVETGIGPECRKILGIMIDNPKPTKAAKEQKDVNHYTGPRTWFASDPEAPPTFGMVAHYNHDNELTHWTDMNTHEVVYND